MGLLNLSIIFGSTFFTMIELSANSAFAEPNPPGQKEFPAELQKVVDFVAKKKACLFATAILCNQENKAAKCHSNMILKNELASKWRTSLLCISDFTRDEGTINEVEGCAFSIYNSAENNYRPVQTMDSFGRADFAIVPGKSCANGGLELLLKTDLGMYHSTNVVKYLTVNLNGNDYSVVPVLSSSPDFQIIVSRVAAEQATNDKEALEKKKVKVKTKKK